MRLNMRYKMIFIREKNRLDNLKTTAPQRK